MRAGLGFPSLTWSANDSQMLCCLHLKSTKNPRSSWFRTAKSSAYVFAIVGGSQTSNAAGGGALEIFPDDRLLIQLAVFAVLVLPIHKILFAPIMRVLKERTEQIDGVRERATEMARQADEALARYRQTVADERSASESIRRERIERALAERLEVGELARQKAEERLSLAREEISRLLDEARSQVRREAPAVAREAASQILGRELP